MSEPKFQKSKLAKRILSVSLFLFISIMLVFALQQHEVANTGVIVMGGGLEVYENDKTTLLSSIDWGTVDVGKSKYFYGWLHLQASSFKWLHNAPNYLVLELYVEHAPSVWIVCRFNETMLATREWMRFYLQLTPNPLFLPTPVNGTVQFNFNITFSTL